VQYFLRRGALQENTTLLIRSDNTATVGDINRLSAAATLIQHLRKLYATVGRRKIHLQAVHLPGVQNEEADRLSRLGQAREYYVKEEVFRRVTEELGLQPEEDAFAASPYLPSEIAPEHPKDALRMKWKGKRLWLHPPPHLLGRTIAKVLREEVQAILIAPEWGAQPWSPTLTQLRRKESTLGLFEEVMTTTERFRAEGWRLPPGNVRATLLDTRMMKGSGCCEGF
jgi:hypothetical protein